METTNLCSLFDSLRKEVQLVKTISADGRAGLVVVPISDILGYLFCLGLAILEVIEIWKNN
jgi:hypothetical protein